MRGANTPQALLGLVQETFAMDGVSLLGREPGSSGTWRVLAKVGARAYRAGRQPPTRPPRSPTPSCSHSAGHPLSADDQRILSAFAAQVAVAYRQWELAEAASAIEPLAASERARTALLNAVSHDLRTPIASAKAAVSSLLAADVTWSAADRDELLRSADVSLDRLTDLVTNLLDLSRLQAGVLPVLTAPVGLDEVLPLALDHAAPMDAPIDVDLPADLPDVLADAGLLERVVANVVQNALRYSPEGARVRITGSTHGGYVELRVVDRGPGIPAAEADAVFAAVPTPRRLAVERGRFRAWAGDRARICRGDGWRRRRGGDARWGSDDRDQAGGVDMTRVLVVEDERTLLRALAMNLTARGYEVTEADSGTRALTAAAAREPDVILLDLGLPDISGLDVIRACARTPPCRSSCLSARTATAEKVAALDLGADDFVTKPFSIDELLARLRAATRRGGSATEEIGEAIQVGTNSVDLEAKTVTAQDGSAIHLTPTEWNLLETLLRHPAKLITGRALLTQLRGTPDHTDPSYLRIYIAQLRKKLEPEPARPRYLLTEPGMGYRFQP